MRDETQALAVNLTRPVRVYIAYVMARAVSGGQTELRPDIYKRDCSAAEATQYLDPEAPLLQSGLAP